MKRAQVAVEFLMILGVLSLAILPIILAMEWNAQNSPDRLAISKATFSAARIASAINSIGNLGVGSKLRVSVEMPQLESAQVDKKAVVLNSITTYGNVAIVQATDFESQAFGFEKIRQEGSYSIDVWKENDGTVSLQLVQ